MSSAGVVQLLAYHNGNSDLEPVIDLNVTWHSTLHTALGVHAEPACAAACHIPTDKV